jgi:hypothetical protein
MKINVAIGFVTGRKHFQNVLRSYINNWLENGLIQDKNIRLHIFVAYDLKYHTTRISDYKNIPPELAGMVDSIIFLDAAKVREETRRLNDNHIIGTAESKLLFGEGYGRKRNIVTYFAIRHKMNRLIFIDDDEYPVAVYKNDFTKLNWMGQSVVGTHLRFIQDADITHGHHCGYISPIPFIKFNSLLQENDFKDFIDAISNDIVSWDKVKKLILDYKGVTYADPHIINNDVASEVKEEGGMKFISGANLCLNLEDTKELPPFYNPPGARGEDTFMSTAISRLKVVKVPCYTFHDGFLKYHNLLNGVLPVALEEIDAGSPAILKRFINAAIGWIRYKPLMIYITRRPGFEAIMDDMKAKLDKSIPRLCAYFNTKEFEAIHREFEHYRARVKKHFKDFTATKAAWKKLMLHNE